jgi:hypothetical protein
MKFSDQVREFTDKAKCQLDEKLKEVEINAEKVLKELLGDDISQIKSIRLDADIGKFYSVDASAVVIEKLRSANFLKE